jgi:hypothetical protein
MKLTLTYQGELPPRRSGLSSVKASLRSAFHPQILAQVAPRLGPDTLLKVTNSVAGKDFVSIAHPNLQTGVELDVLLLTRQGSLTSGDMDNRLKTLIDGLTRPANTQQLQQHTPPEGGGPMYCLADDDARVKRVGVDSRRWFHPNAADGEALVIVTATIVLADDVHLSGTTASLLLVL